MNKEQFIDALHTKIGSLLSVSKEDIEILLSAESCIIEETLSRQEEIKFPGFGIFYVHQQKARTGYNMWTDEKIPISTKKVPKFQPGIRLKKLLRAWMIENTYIEGRKMNKDDIRIKKVIIHIMDSTVGMPVLSDREIEFGSEFADFLKEHIYKTAGGDECKDCEFYKEQSEVYQMLAEYNDERFVELSRQIAELLYGIMNSNIDIPPADLVIVRFRASDEEYLGILKMNFKESYTHRTVAGEEGNNNEIVRYRAILPNQTQRLTEAAIIRLSDRQIKLVEKKYEVNGEKTNYFSYLFLKCSARLSPKAKLNIVTKAVESIQKERYDELEQFGAQMEAKSIIQEELAENGGFVVEEIAEKIFKDEPELQAAFQDKMEKYDMVREEVLPQSEATMKKYQKQYLLTDTGIEIKIPMEQYKDSKSVEFITNEDGTISVLIKNIGHLQAKI